MVNVTFRLYCAMFVGGKNLNIRFLIIIGDIRVCNDESSLYNMENVKHFTYIMELFIFYEIDF